MDTPTLRFGSKREAKLYVAEKSVAEKKPFRVVRSDSERFEVVCPEKGCLFKLNIRVQKDVHFHVTRSSHPHT